MDAKERGLLMIRVERVGRAMLYLADCRDALPVIPDVDAVVTDPPYGIGLDYESEHFADTPAELQELIDTFLPMCRKMARVVSITPGNQNHYLYPQPTWTLCWFNRAGAGSGPWGFSCWQPILCYGPDPYLRLQMGRRPDFIEHSETSEKNGHPCPKPVRFQKLWIDRVACDAETILDPFMGSGTTGVAAVQMGKSFIGIEREERWFDLACKRLDQAQRQGDFFIGEAA
jgi:site-specific DNA-methyltransferase (adenine-specific)/modification methylase